MVGEVATEGVVVEAGEELLGWDPWLLTKLVLLCSLSHFFFLRS